MSPDCRKLSLVIGGSLFAEAKYGLFCSLLSLLPCIKWPSIFSLKILDKSIILYTEKYGELWKCPLLPFTELMGGIHNGSASKFTDFGGISGLLCWSHHTHRFTWWGHGRGTFLSLLWNSIPWEARLAPSLLSFHKQVKIILFRQAFLRDRLSRRQ